MSFKIPAAKPFFPQEDVELLKADLAKILGSGMLTLGEFNSKLEQEFARVHQSKYAVAVSSGTSALEIILRALRLKQTDEVILPTNTFAATAVAVIFAGAKPVFADVDAGTLALSLDTVRQKVTKRTKAIIMVHVGGFVSPAVSELCDFAASRDLMIVEDAAHAQGSSYIGKMAGTFGRAGAFSFYPTKVLATTEGGMITTEDEGIRRLALIMRDHGKESFSGNTIVELGYNWRMNEISAAIALRQLARLDEFITRRRRVAKIFDEGLKDAKGITTQVIPMESKSNYYKYTAFLDRGLNRDAFKQATKARGVSCSGEVYWPPLHMQPVFENRLGYHEGDFPIAEDVCRRIVELPVLSQMTDEEALYATSVVKQVLKGMA